MMVTVTPEVIESDEKYKLSTINTQYELRDGLFVKIKEPTIDLMAAVEEISETTSFMKQNLEVAKIVTDGFDWDDLTGVSSRVVGRIVQDFLYMSAGNATRQ
jgi:hypothetical protein